MAGFGVQCDMDISVMKRRFLALEKGPRRWAYGVTFATNDTARTVVQALQQNMRRKFNVRKPQLWFGSTIYGGAAGKWVKRADIKEQTPNALILIGKEAVEGYRRVLLPLFETGGVRKPFYPGARAYAVPILGRARPSVSGGIPPSLTFAGLHFVAFSGGKRLRRRRRGGHVSDVGVLGEFGRVLPPASGSGAVQWKGRQRTFLLPSTGSQPLGAVLQRFGPGRGDVRDLYAFRTNDPIDNRLHAVDTAKETARAVFPRYLSIQLAQSIAHAREAA